MSKASTVQPGNKTKRKSIEKKRTKRKRKAKRRTKRHGKALKIAFAKYFPNSLT